MDMRKPLIAANWKMFKTPAEAVAFINAFLPLVAHHHHAEIVLCPAMTSLAATLVAAKGSSVHIGAQNMHWLDPGAYTGETSPTQLTAIGATHVLIGHSERRQYFNETDTTVNLKLKSALAHGLIPIVCVGEHLEEREASLTAKVLELQTSVALEGIEHALAHNSSSPTNRSGPSAPAAPQPLRSPTTPTASSAPRSPSPSLRSLPPPSASSMAAPSNPTTPPASAPSKTSTEPSSEEPASTPTASPRS